MEKKLQIRGMTCPHCEQLVAEALTALNGVESVRADYRTGEALLVCTKAPDLEQAEERLQALGYGLDDPKAALTRAVSLAVIILGLAIILDRLGLLTRLAPRQLGENGMSYGMFFVTGLLTSLHCTAMCGGILLSQSLPGRGRFSALTYNLGRVVSYTAIGAALGLAGRLLGGGGFATSPLLQGCVKLLAGAVMVLAGVNLLGLFPALRRLRLVLPTPRLHSGAPFAVGLLNGLMPCGPLQAMQLAALGSGSPSVGALSMLAFSLGTVPLMLLVGSLASALGRRFTRPVTAAGAVLVTVFGIAMLAQGGALSGMVNTRQLWIALATLTGVGLVSLLPLRRPLRLGLDALLLAAVIPTLVRTTPALRADVDRAHIVDGVQLVTSTLEPGGYPSISVRAGVPVVWTIHAEEDAINGCNYRMLIPDWGLELSFEPGDNQLEFTPEEAGSIPTSCWMGMLRGSITVTE